MLLCNHHKTLKLYMNVERPPIQVIVQRSVKTASDTQAVLIVEQDARRQFRDSSGGS
jgi:hypothetical protein